MKCPMLGRVNHCGTKAEIGYSQLISSGHKDLDLSVHLLGKDSCHLNLENLHELETLEEEKT